MGYIDWGQIPTEDIAPGVRRKVATSDKMTFTYWMWDRGVEVPQHQHPEEQFSYIISGKLEFRCNGESRLLGAGDSWLTFGNAPHGSVFLEDTVTLEIFSPPRQDILSGSDTFARAAVKR